MTSITDHGVRIECIRGDIARQNDIDVVVNAANAALAPGGGVAGAIHRAAGPDLYREAEGLAPIVPGEAVITGGYTLPNTYVIHCLGPRYGIDQPASELLAACYLNALALAEEKRARSIAFPAISAGAFGYPVDEAAHVAVATIRQAAADRESVRLVRFVLFGSHDYEVFAGHLEGE